MHGDFFATDPYWHLKENSRKNNAAVETTILTQLIQEALRPSGLQDSYGDTESDVILGLAGLPLSTQAGEAR